MVNDAATDVQRILAANLRRLRIARHLSLSELARATTMSKATLSGVENGRANPTVETLAALADALRVSLTELLEESGSAEITVVRAEPATTESAASGSAVARPAAAGSGPDRLRRRALAALAPVGALAIAELSLAPGVVHEAAREASGTRAHVYVVQGRVLAGPVERVTELTPGDYASFPIDVPYVFETARHPARILMCTAIGR